MTFEEILDQAIAMLQRRGRVTYRALERQHICVLLGYPTYSAVAGAVADLNAYAERWVRAVKEECLSRMKALYGLYLANLTMPPLDC